MILFKAITFSSEADRGRPQDFFQSLAGPFASKLPALLRHGSGSRTMKRI